MRIIVIAVLSVLSILLAPQAARSGCGSASCPIDVATAEHTGAGDIRLDYTYIYSDQTRARIESRNASVGEIRGHHDEVSTLNIIQKVSVEAGLTPRLSLQLSVPMVHREHRHIHHHMGADINDSWNFDGVGDLEVLSRYAFINRPDGGLRASVILGGVLPTGRDSAVNERGDAAEVGILPGKEAYSLIAGASLARAWSAKTATGAYARLPAFISSTYQWNGQGTENYKIGNMWISNAGIVYPILPKVGVILQTNVHVSRKDDAGNTREEIQKTGGTFVYLTPGLRLTLTDDLWSFFQVQLPVYQYLNSIQLTSAVNLMGGVSYRFSAL